MSAQRPVVDERTGERLQGGRLHDLYIRHSDEAVRLAYLVTGDAALAEDLVQEAFLRLVGRFLHIRSPAGFRAYLRRTVVNLAISHHRRRAVERRALVREAGGSSLEPASSAVEEREAFEGRTGDPSSPTAGRDRPPVLRGPVGGGHR